MSGYGDDEEFEAWMTANGRTVPESAPSFAVLRQRGSDYLDALYGQRFIGYPTGGLNQERAWPRTDATAWGQHIGTSVIPSAVILASYAAACHEGNNPGALSAAASAGKAVKRRKVDVIEIEYFGGESTAVDDATIRLSEVEGLLAPFIRPADAGSIGLWAVGQC